MKPGTRIRLTHAVSFTDGTRSDTFTYARLGQGTPGFLVLGRSRCRIPNWRDSVAALIEAEDCETLTPLGEEQAAIRAQKSAAAQLAETAAAA